MTNVLFNRIHFPRPQAFASPSDMASSGVWENVFLATTPTFVGKKSITNDKYVKIWQYKHPKLYIITFHIHHQKWVLWQGKHFPIHQMKPCQMDWRKLVVLEKCILLKRILVISLKLIYDLTRKGRPFILGKEQ